jgi:hypothetical protein
MSVATSYVRLNVGSIIQAQIDKKYTSLGNLSGIVHEDPQWLARYRDNCIVRGVLILGRLCLPYSDYVSMIAFEINRHHQNEIRSHIYALKNCQQSTNSSLNGSTDQWNSPRSALNYG